ncbi:MAG: hypothetical protein ACXWMX_03605 [Candidatus Limnocylindrales bacterium]
MIHNSLRRSLGFLATVVLVASACSSGSSPSPSSAAGGSAAPASASLAKIGGTVSVLGTWTGDEQASFMAMVKPFEDATGVKVQYTGTRDLNAQLSAGVKSGTLPDLAGLPGVGPMQEYAAQGSL